MIFPKAGNYEIVCLVHGQMFGVIYVLDPTLPLPHDQAFYDEQAREQLKGLLEDADRHQHHAEHQDSIGVHHLLRLLSDLVPCRSLV